MSKRWVMSSGLLALTGALASAACGGDDSPPEEAAAGSTSAGDDDGTAGTTSGTAGTTSGTAGTTSGTAYDGPGYACDHFAVPGEGLITDFSEVSAGEAAFTWGTSVTLTGGTHLYGAPDELPVSTDGEGTATVAATLEANGDYAGIVFWFGPCVDASSYTGVELVASGDIPNTQMLVQLQMAKNYPIDDTNSKGQCEFTDAATQWSECTNHSKVVEGLTEEAQTLQIPFDEFTGGQPVAPLEPAELLGMQVQFQCGEDAPCPFSVTFESFSFY